MSGPKEFFVATIFARDGEVIGPVTVFAKSFAAAAKKLDGWTGLIAGDEIVVKSRPLAEAEKFGHPPTDPGIRDHGKPERI